MTLLSDFLYSSWELLLKRHTSFFSAGFFPENYITMGSFILYDFQFLKLQNKEKILCIQDSDSKISLSVLKIYQTKKLKAKIAERKGKNDIF